MLLVLPYSGELSGTLYKGQQKLNMYKLTIYKMIFSTWELKNNVIKLFITNEDVKMILKKNRLINWVIILLSHLLKHWLPAKRSLLTIPSSYDLFTGSRPNRCVTLEAWTRKSLQTAGKTLPTRGQCAHRRLLETKGIARLYWPANKLDRVD